MERIDDFMTIRLEALQPIRCKNNEIICKNSAGNIIYVSVNSLNSDPKIVPEVANNLAIEACNPKNAFKRGVRKAGDTTVYVFYSCGGKNKPIKEELVTNVKSKKNKGRTPASVNNSNFKPKLIKKSRKIESLLRNAPKN